MAYLITGFSPIQEPICFTHITITARKATTEIQLLANYTSTRDLVCNTLRGHVAYFANIEVIKNK